MFDALIRDGMAAMHRAAFDEAAGLFQQAETIAANEADRALATMRLAGIEVLQRNGNANLSVLRENVMRRHSAQHVVIASYYLTVAAIDAGDREAATRYLPVLLDAAHEIDDPVWMVMAFDAAAGAESICGNHVGAIEYGMVALDSAAEAEGEDGLFLRAGLTHNLAYNCLAASEYEKALRYAVDAVTAAERLDNEPLLRQALTTEAFAYLCRDRLDEALAAIARAEPLIAGTYLEKYMHYLRGEVARRRGDLDEAAVHFKRLEALYPGIPSLTEMLLSMNLAPFLLPE